MVEEPVEDFHVAVVGEAEVADAASLALFQEEVEQAVVEEAGAEVVHAAASHGVQQVVVDVVYLQSLEGAAVHLLRLLEAVEVASLVRHLRGDVVRLARVAAKGIARDVLGGPVGGCRVEVVDAVGQGVVDHSVHLVLALRQSHHAEAQERHLVARVVVDAIGHLAGLLSDGTLGSGGVCKGPQWFQYHEAYGRCRSDAKLLEELSAAVVIRFFHHGSHINIVWFLHLRLQRYELFLKSEHIFSTLFQCCWRTLLRIFVR